MEPAGRSRPSRSRHGTGSPRRTRILATLGPATSSAGQIRGLLDAGADAFRINFSHGTQDSHRRLIREARRAASRNSQAVAIIGDLQGPKIRIGPVDDDSIQLVAGRSILLDSTTETGTADRLAVTLPGLESAARPGDPVLLGDGAVELRVESVGPDSIRARVTQGGSVHSHQGIYLPRARLRGPILDQKDLEDLGVALDEGVDFVALSFVAEARDVVRAREEIRRRTDRPVGIISKIERARALGSIERILEVSDAIMVARGDLGIEVPLERLAIEQKRLVLQGQRAGRQTIVATQMLLSMVSSPRPTRAEATDVANAILDGADAVMLSEESAVGSHATLAVRWMDRIARATEGSIPRERFRTEPVPPSAARTEHAVADSAVRTAEATHAGAIVVPTHSGHTAQLVSRLRPGVPILAISRLDSTRRRLALTWGVRTAPAPASLPLDQLRQLAERTARREFRLPRGRPIVMTAGYPVEGRPTNLVLVTSA